MNIYEFAEQKHLSIKQPMDFTSVVNPLGLSRKAKNAMRKAVKYVEFPPDRKLRNIYRLIQKRENIGRENIVFGNGIHCLIDAAMKIANATTASLPIPVSSSYRALLSGNFTGIDNSIMKEGGFRYKPESVLETVRRLGPGVVIIPSPHDLVGSSLDQDELREITKESDRSGAFVVIDESLREFTRMESPVQQVIRSERTLILRTFSSYHAMPGLPFAYGIGPSWMIQRMQEQLSVQEINLLAPKAAIASLRDRTYAQRTFEFIHKEKNYMMEKLQSLDVPFCDTKAPFIILGFEKDPEEMRSVFSRYNILIDEFFTYEKQFHLRVPVKQHRMNAAFVKTLRGAIKIVNSEKVRNR